MAFEIATSPGQLSPVASPPYQVTKPPPWHGLIVMDLFCAELAAGLFIVAALGDLVAHGAYGAASRIGYIAAFPIAFIDVLCLVFDLGDPLRFHHMLRVFKLRSPMSIGTWAVSGFSILSFVCFVLAILNLPGLAQTRAIIGGIGIPIALFVGGYKGVMLSCTAQPVWKSARWLGAELVTSAALLGTAALLLVAVLLPAASAEPGLRLAELIMLCINFIFTLAFTLEAYPQLVTAHSRQLLNLGGLLLVGWIVPIVLLLLGAAPGIIASACLILAAGIAYRFELVMYPHRLSKLNQQYTEPVT